MKKNILRDSWEVYKVELAACRATPELKEQIETNSKYHTFLKGASALASK